MHKWQKLGLESLWELPFIELFDTTLKRCVVMSMRKYTASEHAIDEKH